jgi:hypothetical protein
LPEREEALNAIASHAALPPNAVTLRVNVTSVQQQPIARAIDAQHAEGESDD